MAGFFDPFSPGQTDDPSAGVDPGTYDRVRQEWDAFLGNPQGRAALLSAGLSLMQPPSFGDTGASQIGRAIGVAGESATSNQVMGMKEREQESKAELRDAQAGAAEARANAAGARAGTAGSRLELQGERIRAMGERNLLNNRVRLSQMYQNYTRDIAKANANASLLGGQQQPVLPMPDWIKQNPMLSQMGLLPTKGVGGEDDDEVDTTVSPPTTSGSAAATTPAPRDPAARQAGKVYETPKGPLKWTGTGWVSP